ncbi:MAG: hypothetical protein LUF02_03150 [Erysipelotrichaceae bacterium]|nr:hypothetical protein [Erysipelotrichaceae bacterium]
MDTIKMKLSKLTSIDLSKGKPLQTIMTFAIPLLIANIFQMLYTTVDTMVVGKCVSSIALAAVGAATPVIDLLLGLDIGLANGLSIVIAQKIGSGNTKETRKTIINGFYLTTFIAVLVMILGLLFNRTLFHLINVSDELMSGAISYTTVIFIGTLFAAYYNYESAILNVVLDLFLVVVFHLGIAGVALATIIAQLICCALCFLYMKNSLGMLSFEKDEIRFSFNLIAEQTKIALPMAFFQSLLAISFLVVQSALNTLGSDEVAAYTAAYKMDSLMMQVLSAFGTAVSTFTAQNYGNKSYDRIKLGANSMLKVTITLSIIVTILAQLLNQQFMSLFVSANESYIIQLGTQYISFTSCFYFILGINFIVRFVLVGIGESSIPLGVGILEIIVRFLGTYLLIYPLDFTGMIYINPLCWGTSTFLIICIYPYLLKKAFNR